jgi:hypothetical protein
MWNSKSGDTIPIYKISMLSPDYPDYRGLATTELLTLLYGTPILPDFWAFLILGTLSPIWW